MRKEIDINNEKCFRTIVEHSTDAIAILSQEGDFLFVTPSVEAVLGYTRAEAMDLDVFSLTHPEDRENLSGAWKAMLNISGKPVPIQIYRLKHKDGTWRRIESSLKNLLHDPVVKGIINNFRDVTDSVSAINQNIFDKNNLEALINNTRDFMWSIDRDFKLITANNAFIEIVRMITGQAVRRGDSVFIEGFSNDQHEKYKKIYERVFEGEVVTEMEYTEQPIEIWSEISYYPIWDKDVVIGAACHSRDISAIKKAERRKQFNKYNLEALINSTVDMIWSVDKEIKLITGNQPFIDIMHSFVGKEVGKGDHILSTEVPQELTLKYMEYYQRALAGEIFSIVDYFEFPKEMWLQVSFHPIHSDDEIIGVACHSKDITKEKKIEHERIKNEARLKESQSLAKLGHWELNLATGEAVWSDESCRIYGLSVEDNLHSFEDWLTFIHPDDMASVLSEIEVAQKTLSDLEMNHRIKLRDGTVKHIASKTKFEFDETGKVPVGLYGVAYDITAEKVAEAELKQKAKELELSNAELEQFAYTASHDLQEPLRMITGFLNQLENKYSNVLDDKARQYIYFAVDGAKRMRQIILDMLEYSKVGKTDEKFEEVDLNVVVNDIKVLLNNQIEDKQAVVEYKNLPVICSKGTPLRQVFQNLIGNGLKYTAAGVVPRIKIEAKEENDHWTISVSDNGIGINKAYFEKIFTLFQRLHSKEEFSGTGIGLAITKKIIEHLGGEIWLESEEGKGSVFYFMLPK